MKIVATVEDKRWSESKLKKQYERRRRLCQQVTGMKELDLEEARASGVTEGETEEELEHRGKLFSKSPGV